MVLTKQTYNTKGGCISDKPEQLSCQSRQQCLQKTKSTWIIELATRMPLTMHSNIIRNHGWFNEQTSLVTSQHYNNQKLLKNKLLDRNNRAVKATANNYKTRNLVEKVHSLQKSHISAWTQQSSQQIAATVCSRQLVYNIWHKHAYKVCMDG